MPPTKINIFLPPFAFHCCKAIRKSRGRSIALLTEWYFCTHIMYRCKYALPLYTGIYITNDIFAFSTLVKKVHFFGRDFIILLFMRWYIGKKKMGLARPTYSWYFCLEVRRGVIK